MKLLFMVLHGDCPLTRRGEQMPKMQMVKLHPDGRTIEFLCHTCGGKIRLSQKVLVAPPPRAVESPEDATGP